MARKSEHDKRESRKRSTANLKPFVKGDPRINRKGQPKKILKLQKVLEEVLGITDGSQIDKSDIALIIKAIANKAKKGDVFAAREILDRLYGKVKQVIELPSSEARDEVSKLMPFAKPKKD